MTPVTWLVADAATWLPQQHDLGSIVTGPADAAEMGMPTSDYAAWLYRITQLLLQATSDDAVTITLTTDRKHDGGLISKAGIILRACHDLGGHRVLWHKIALRRHPGRIDLHRPGYTHAICMSRTARPGAATPDVIPPGPRLYANGNDLNSVQVCIDMARRTSDRLTDPFCGRGTIPVIAAAEGMTATGVDIDPAQIERARQLRVRPRATVG